jgi:hypothetical protein
MTDHKRKEGVRELEHSQRMSEKRLPKPLCQYKRKDRRCQGRPNEIWKEQFNPCNLNKPKSSDLYFDGDFIVY